MTRSPILVLTPDEALGARLVAVVDAVAERLPPTTEALSARIRDAGVEAVVIAGASPGSLAAVREGDPSVAVIGVVDPQDGPGMLALLRAGAASVVDRATLDGLADAVAQARAETLRRRASATGAVSRADAALRATSDGVWDWNLVTNEVFHSETWSRMLGYRPDEIEPHIDAFYRLVHPDDLAPSMAVLQGAITSGEDIGTTEFRLRHRAGHWVTVSVRAALFRDATGRPTRVVGTNRDITEQRRQEAALVDRLALRERIASFASTVPGLFYSVQLGQDGAISSPFLSGAIADLLGVDPQDLPAGFQAFLSRLAPEDVLGIAASARNIPPDGVPVPTDYHYRHPTKGERRLAGRAVAHRQRDGSVTWTGYIEDVTDRSRAEGALRESEARSTLALAAARMGIWEWDVLTDRVYWSPDCVRIVGEPTLEGSIAGLADRVHQDDVASVRAAISRAIDAEDTIEVGFRVEQTDGSLRWVHATMRATAAAEGPPTRVIGLLQDVTARHAVEERLHLQGAALEATANAICISDRTGVLEWVNPAFTRLSGYSREEVAGRPVGEIDSHASPDDPAHAQRAAVLLAGQTWSGQHQNRRKDGSVYIEAETITPVVDDTGAVVHFVSVKEDVTARLDAQRELVETQHALLAHRERLEETVSARTADLAASEARLRLILESSADGLYGLDVDGRVTFVNPAACKMLGTPAEALVGRSIHGALQPLAPDRTPYNVETCPLLGSLRGATPVRRTGDYYTRADGTTFPVSYAVQPMIQGGQTLGAVVSFSDITAQEQAEAARATALREAERLAQARSEFVANMSHEIRTPLNAVLGLAQIGERTTVGRRARDTFHRILDAGQHLLGVIDDILDFSKIEAGKVVIEQVETDLGAVIDRAVDLTASRAWAKGLQLWVEEAPDLPERITGDLLRLSQILMNLLSNAVKFTERGHVALVVARDGDVLRFRVEDTGIGMTHEQLIRTARPFQQADSSTTRRFGGTGLGLAITQQLIAAMGGTLSVASEPGVGTSFEVRLPVTGIVEPSPAAGLVALVGAAPAEATRITTALRARGLEVLDLSTREPIPPHAMVLVQADALAVRATMQATVGAIERGQTVAVCVRTGETAAPYSIRDRVVELEEPLRARQVVASLRQERRRGGAVPETGRLADYTILAAEDNEINRLVLDELLGAEGARVVCVENGRRAVDRIREDGPEAFDLVLADVQMPEMDGYQATRRIHELRPSMPVIALTAHATPEERARCLEAGMVEHVAKPFDIDRLVEVIRKHAPRRPAAPPPPEPPPPPPIDWSVLDARFRMRTGFIVQLLTTMLASHATTVQDLVDAAGRGDLDRIAFLAHTVKGMAGNLTATHLHGLAGEAERLARAGDPAAADRARAVAEALAALLEVTELRIRELQG